MFKTNKRKFIVFISVICLTFLLANGLDVFAAGTGNTTEKGDVAGAVEKTWDEAKVQIKKVVNNVVFPVIDLILAVLFFVKIGLAYMDYRKHGQFEFTAPAILFACLVFTLTAPLYVWEIIGM